jgi:N-acetylated-alpha-linked acidic dipeptidase
MRRSISLPLAVLGLPLAAMAFTPATTDDKPLLGFTAQGASAQFELEARFDSYLNRGNLQNWDRRMSSQPNHVGSRHGKENAEFLAALLRDWGYETRIETFHVLFPTPRTRVLELLEPQQFTARLAEPAIPEDATSGVTEDRLPTYNAFSADGDVTAELVYVNYGVPADYEELARRGIDVAGKIVIARYGGSWRGIKPKVAAEHGAIGCLIYSDPRDDGYFQGDVYPVGPYRMEHGAQRGSVLDMPLHPGDPLTPFTGATEDAERLAIEDAETVMKIPVLPISYADALPLLRAMAGPVAPAAWRGALPITYHLGPGPATVHLKLELNWDLTPAYDVIAMLPGAELPDEWVIRGNHRDAWVFGGGDPLSGTVAMLEEARAIAELTKTGWRPKRTIVFGSWDAEEPGLLGSTEWAEHHADELRQKAVVYMNTDSYGRGFIGAGGSHALERFVNQVARDVVDPQTGVSVWERARAARLVGGDSEARTRADLRIGPLGSGSDYTPFLQHLGVASLNIGYGGESGGGSYHSIFDSYDYYTRFGDPNFTYGITLAQTMGRATLRFANADVLPFRFANLVDNVAQYYEQVTALLEDTRAQTESENYLVESRAYELAADPTKTYVVPTKKSAVPYLSFAPIQNALARMKRNAQSYDEALRLRMSDGPALDASTRESLDGILMSVERLMTHEEGLPGRPWFRHQIYAPGFYTGYGVKTLPGVREAIEQRRWELAEQYVGVIGDALNRVAAALSQAKELLDGGR